MRKLKETTVFAFSGRAGSGKTTSALHLMTLFPGFDVQKFMMAWKIKNIATQMGWNGDKDNKGRKLLQVIGRYGREYDIDTWVNQVITEIQRSKPDIAVIDDLRFPNEMTKLVDAFNEIYFIRLTRNPLNMNDISETSMDEVSHDSYDRYLVNTNLSIEQTNAEITAWLNHKFDFMQKAAA